MPDRLERAVCSTPGQLLSELTADAAGRRMYALIAELYPLCRSITGDGVRKSHEILRRVVPLRSYEVPTGTEVFDWTIPNEWNIRDAYLKDPSGRIVCSFQEHNICVLGYSVPVRARLSLEELRPHLRSLPEQPDVIPYLTSYYSEDWGFCLPHRVLEALPEGEYEVCIDSTLAPGSLTYGEVFLPGETDEEVLISCYTCHPSLCNDNLSGVALAAILAQELQHCALRYSYRFLFIPETIGAIAWLALNEGRLDRIRHGLVATCLGDPGCSTYKKSRRGDAEIDRAVLHVLQHSGEPYNVLDFFPSGSDERQFCSPAFDLPVGSLMRTPYARFKEYHTSADDLSFVQPEFLGNTFRKYLQVVSVLEGNRCYLNLNPKCEPQLGKRGLYSAVGGLKKQPPNQVALRWVLNFSDGKHSLLDICERSGLEFSVIRAAADTLCECGLLAPADAPAGSHEIRN